VDHIAFRGGSRDTLSQAGAFVGAKKGWIVKLEMDGHGVNMCRLREYVAESRENLLQCVTRNGLTRKKLALSHFQQIASEFLEPTFLFFIRIMWAWHELDPQSSVKCRFCLFVKPPIIVIAASLLV